MGKTNPFAVLELTPRLVRLLQNKPARLIKLAEAHRRWMLAEFHPDIYQGDPELPKRITEALASIKDADQRPVAIEEFLGPVEARQEVFVSRIRTARQELEAERGARKQDWRQAQERRRELEELLVRCQWSLSAWAAEAMRPRDDIELRSQSGAERISLTATLLLTATPAGRDVACFIVGPGRQVYRYVERPRWNVDGPFEVKPPTERPAPLKTVLGSYHGGRPRAQLPLRFAASPAGLAELAGAVEPFLEIGRPLAVLERDTDGLRLSVHDPLVKVKRGSFKVGNKKVGKNKKPVEILRWVAEKATPASPPKAHPARQQ